MTIRFLNPPNKKLFGCPICKDKFYEKSQALGGHLSKSHPLKSVEFKRKQERRKEREPIRKMQKLAKAIYYETYPQDVII